MPIIPVAPIYETASVDPASLMLDRSTGTIGGRHRGQAEDIRSRTRVGSGPRTKRRKGLERDFRQRIDLHRLRRKLAHKIGISAARQREWHSPPASRDGGDERPDVRHDRNCSRNLPRNGNGKRQSLRSPRPFHGHMGTNGKKLDVRGCGYHSYSALNHGCAHAHSALPMR